MYWESVSQTPVMQRYGKDVLQVIEKRRRKAVDWFVLAAVGILAVMAGFWVGRWSGQVSPVGAEGALEGGFPENGEFAESSKNTVSYESFRADVTEGTDVVGSAEFEEPGRALGREGSAADESLGDRIMGGRTAEHKSMRDKTGRAEGRGGKDSRDGRVSKGTGIYKNRGRKHHSGREKKIPLGWAIGSPVSGRVSAFYEGSRRGALLVPDQGRIFAPASGKIIRLYPMGNRMLLRTDSGVELLIQVGGEADELCSMYFRPRVVQNEIVCKGKLLLEYDRERLAAEGVDTGVSISVEEAGNLRDITITEVECVKAGEELLWVREHKYLT